MKPFHTLKGLALSLTLLVAAVVALAPNAAVAFYGPGANIQCPGTVDPGEVRFSQDSIAKNFSNGTAVQTLIDQLNDGTKTAADVDPIRLVIVDPSQVVRQGGHQVAAGVYTIDNRRLYAFQQANKSQIRCENLSNGVPQNQRFKFTTDNNGTSITVRQ